MIDPQNMHLIQILVTNKCNMNCCHCSQMCPLQTNLFNMSLKEVENALQSLEGYNGHIGMFGGEPTLHPQFEEICKLYQKYIPVKARRELWTNGAKYKKYEKIIKDTFYDELVAYNEHEEQQPCWHQPNNIAIEEIFDGSVTGDSARDVQIMWDLINNCWVQLRWSACITPKGAYFCEVAAARAHMLGGPDGIPVKPGWWKQPIETWNVSIGELCSKCSMCVPMKAKPNDSQEHDDMSEGNIRLLKDKKVKREIKEANLYEIRNYLRGHDFVLETDWAKRGWLKDFPEYRPNIYRPFSEKKHKPEDVKEKKNEGKDKHNHSDKK